MTSRLILAYVEREGGRAALDALLARTGLQGCEEALRDENRWFAFRTKIALFDAAAEVLGDEQVAERVGRAALDLDIGTALKRVLRALGSPRLVYGQVARACGKFNATHRMIVDALDACSARIRYEDVSGVGHHARDCSYNVGLLATVPELFGLEAATVSHPECAVRGAPACVYDLRWSERVRPAAAPAWACGASAAAGAVALAGVTEAVPFAVALALAAGALVVRSARRVERRLRHASRRMREQDEAADSLAASLRDLSSDLRLDEVLAKIARHAQSAVGGKEYALVLAEEVRSSGVPPQSLAALARWAHGGGLPASEEAVVIDDLATVPALARLPTVAEMPLRSLCAAPLRFHGRLLGVLFALAHAPEAFLAADAALLHAYAAQAAVALANAQMVERLRRLADEDPLTGLANHRNFHRALGTELSRADRDGQPLALIALDLDHFKRFNDTFGHPAGDDLLRSVGEALRGVMRASDVVARVGGEEFAMVLPGATAAEARRLAERARAAVAAVSAKGVTITCSAGVAAFPADAGEAATLLRGADQALYEAKRAGRNRTRTFDRGGGWAHEHHRALAARARIEEVLAEPGAIGIVCQPIVALASGEVVGYEALARFPTLGLRPDVAFAAAHESGLGPEVEAAAIRRALALPARPPGTALSVNVSLSALAAPNLWAALPADMTGLTVEITEHELYEDDEQLQVNLGRLRERGAQVAVDDAGAGYAGLQQIVRVAPDVVKLDRSLISDVHSDPAKAALIEAFVRFAQKTGTRVCAEGVESAEELRALATLGVDSAQGFLLGRPALGWPEVSADAAPVLARPPARTAGYA